MNARQLVALVTTASMLSACGSIIEGSTDEIEIIASPPANLQCSATNSRGSWNGGSPGSVSVKKSRTDLAFQCTDRASGLNGATKLESGIEPWAIGSVILGGLIGIGIDWMTGAAYDYPSQVVVPVGAPTAAAPAPSSVEYYAPPPQVETVPAVQPDSQAAPVEPAPMAAPATGYQLQQPSYSVAPTPQRAPGTIAPLPYSSY